LAYTESGLLILGVIASESKLGIVFNIIALVSALLVPTILVVIAREFERTRA
jgi:uncharacterized membrane protein (DUF485 family)